MANVMSKKSLPPFYRFRPSGEQLIIDYLHNHVSGKPLPCADAVLYRDVYATEPSKLLPDPSVDNNYEAFFFSTRTNKGKGSRRCRKAGPGSWKLEKKEDILVGPEVVGHKAVLSYHINSDGSDNIKKRTKASGWVMHEYVLGSKEDDSSHFKPLGLYRIRWNASSRRDAAGRDAKRKKTTAAAASAIGYALSPGEQGSGSAEEACMASTPSTVSTSCVEEYEWDEAELERLNLAMDEDCCTGQPPMPTAFDQWMAPSGVPLEFEMVTTVAAADEPAEQQDNIEEFDWDDLISALDHDRCLGQPIPTALDQCVAVPGASLELETATTVAAANDPTEQQQQSIEEFDWDEHELGVLSSALDQDCCSGPAMPLAFARCTAVAVCSDAQLAFEVATLAVPDKTTQQRNIEDGDQGSKFTGNQGLASPSAGSTGCVVEECDDYELGVLCFAMDPSFWK